MLTTVIVRSAKLQLFRPVHPLEVLPANRSPAGPLAALSGARETLLSTSWRRRLSATPFHLDLNPGRGHLAAGAGVLAVPGEPLPQTIAGLLRRTIFQFRP